MEGRGIGAVEPSSTLASLIVDLRRISEGSDRSERPFLEMAERVGRHFRAQLIAAVDDSEEVRAPTVQSLAAVASPILAVPSGDASAVVEFGSLRLGRADSWSDGERVQLEILAELIAEMGRRDIVRRRVTYLERHDEPTGTVNRRVIEETLDAQLADEAGGSVAAIAVDLDRVAVLDGYLGHAAGDLYLRTISDRLTDRFGHGRVGRVGPHSFVVLPDGPLDDQRAEEDAREIRRIVSRPVPIDNLPVVRTASIGVAVAEPGSVDAHAIVRRAGSAAERARTLGGDVIATYTEFMDTDADLRDELEIQLYSAIRDDAFVLFYQPEIDLRTGEILAVEALVRWQHPTRGLLPPSVFVPIAEEGNLAADLGRWVLERACTDLAGWHQRVPDRRIGMRVNVSPVELATPGYIETARGIVARAGVAAADICLELTEVAVVDDVLRTRLALAALVRLGFRFAIDDFGTGYSSLLHLRELPFHTLKIDRTFVSGLGRHADDLAIVQSIVGLAEAMDLEVVAEGVETEPAARILLELGCTRAQGYLFSRPVPREEIEQLLTQGRSLIDGDPSERD